MRTSAAFGRALVSCGEDGGANLELQPPRASAGGETEHLVKEGNQVLYFLLENRGLGVSPASEEPVGLLLSGGRSSLQAGLTSSGGSDAPPERLGSAGGGGGVRDAAQGHAVRGTSRPSGRWVLPWLRPLLTVPVGLVLRWETDLHC